MARRLALLLIALCVLAGGVSAATVVALDNDSPSGVSFVGTWSTSSVIGGYIGGNYAHNGQDPAKTATYAPTLPYAGLYQVEAIWTSDTSRHSQATYTITHAGGVAVVTQDQRANGGTWQTLGTFQFTGTPTDSVLVSAPDGTGFLIADGMRFFDPATVGTGDPRYIPSAGLTATASSYISTSNRPPARAIDGSGMSDTDLDGVPDTHAASGNGDNITWLSAAGDTAGWYVVDLGATYPLDEIRFWNFNSSSRATRGVGQGDWYVSTADNPTGRNFATDPDWTLMVDNFTFTAGPGTNDYDDPTIFDMGGVSARWVALDIDSSLGDSYVGFSEVQFYRTLETQGDDIPEPLTLTALLAGLGLSGGYLRRRRTA